jgi:photosystem II stability/assembly factor-like uncharacterized protein
MQYSIRSITTTLLFLFLFVQSIHAQIVPSTDSDMQAAARQKKSIQATSLFKNLPLLNVGPVIQGGRVTDVDVDPRKPETYYVAYASGGLFKTINNGASFEPVFDGNDALGIGDFTVSTANPDVLWVGSGENNSSRSSYAGAGIYKSTDAGKSWSHMGLRHSQHMGRIITHPSDENIAWVASLGSLYSYNSERGLYKTIDGGKTWNKTLFVNDSTGVIDIAIHPTNPNILWASSWERSRKANNFKGNGPGSGIWKSEDGGLTWKRSMKGFPDGPEVGRIGLSVSLSNPNVIYALLDNQEEVRTEARRQQAGDGLQASAIRGMTSTQFASVGDDVLEKYLRDNRYPAKYTAASVKKSVASKEYSPADVANWLGDANTALFNSTVKGAEVYRSNDGGETWTKTHTPRIDNLYSTYGYYFGEIRVSPHNENEIYILGVPLLTSKDGGKTFEQIDNKQVDVYGNRVHVDHQALWINPKNSNHIILGNDGGLYITWDRGEHWTHYNNKPVGQFYTVNVDMATPYNIYGGMQDNGVYFGSSKSIPNKTRHWEPISGGDGMHVVPDPRNHNIVISGSQFGSYARYDREKGTRVSITPQSDIGKDKHRFNWNTPVVMSPHNPDIIYMGSQYLMRSMRQGDQFEVISPDLTNNHPQGNVPYSSITTISESKYKFGMIWVGTDDGNVQLTLDGGMNWKNVTSNLPKNLWVAKVQASPHDQATAFVALTGYRYDDFTAYLYKTSDYGQTWTSINGNIPMEATNVILQDFVNPDLLFAGTDHGSYSSLDGGKTWHTLNGMPNVASYDMVIHPRESELVIGTHGRSIFLMDVKPLRDVKGDMIENGVQVWQPSPMRRMPNWGAPVSPIFSRGPEAPEMPVLYYTGKAGKTTIKISNDDGTFIHEQSFDSERGFSHYKWNLKGANPKTKSESFASVGTYSMEISNNGKTAKTTITLTR